MKTKKQIEEQIALIRREHSFAVAVSKKLNSISHGTYGLNRVKVNTKHPKDFVKVLKEYPTVNTESEVWQRGKIASPFTVKLKNPATNTVHFPFELIIDWESEKGVELNVHFPIEFIKELGSGDHQFVEACHRRVSDCEYVHFTGMSTSRLQALQVVSYRFKDAEQVNWYGGDRTLLDALRIKDIVNAILYASQPKSKS